MNGDYHPGTFLKQLIPHLTVGIDLEINVGFSFIAIQSQHDLEPKFSYFFAAQDLCTIKGTFVQREEAMKFAKELEKQNYSDLLKETFFSTESGERFLNSRIGPYCLVACYIWISK